jgi:hypothetical protein
MGSGAVIYVPSFIKIGSGVRKLIRGRYTGTHTHTHGQQRDLISLLCFFEIRKVERNKRKTGILKTLKRRECVKCRVFTAMNINIRPTVFWSVVWQLPDVTTSQF